LKDRSKYEARSQVSGARWDGASRTAEIGAVTDKERIEDGDSNGVDEDE
jgi:hypothetical protein